MLNAVDESLTKTECGITHSIKNFFSINEYRKMIRSQDTGCDDVEQKYLHTFIGKQ